MSPEVVRSSRHVMIVPPAPSPMTCGKSWAPVAVQTATPLVVHVARPSESTCCTKMFPELAGSVHAKNAPPAPSGATAGLRCVPVVPQAMVCWPHGIAPLCEHLVPYTSFDWTTTPTEPPRPSATHRVAADAPVGPHMTLPLLLTRERPLQMTPPAPSDTIGPVRLVTPPGTHWENDQSYGPSVSEPSSS